MYKTLFSFALTMLLFIGCQEKNIIEPEDELSGSLQKTGPEQVVHSELQALKAATAKYNDIKKALADGYIDINVVVPHMGHHFLNPAYLDENFELTKPEHLVYTKTENGKYKLVSVEYGVPLAIAPAPPEGFTGDFDVWERNEEAGIWALHAWVWKKNPDGVFASFNPDVP